MNTVVSGALDRLHYEKDPCVKYDIGRKLWIYLHRSRSQEEFGKQPGAVMPRTLWRTLDPKASCLAAAEDEIRLVRISTACCGMKKIANLCFPSSQRESTRLKLLLPKHEKPFNRNPNPHPSL